MSKKYSVTKHNGIFPRRHFIHYNPLLDGVIAYNHSLVHSYWNTIVYTMRPKSDLLLLSPCSNVKPYPLSPVNTKIKFVLKQLGLWNNKKDVPLIDWVFISDLLGPVPYEYTWIEPACCYEAPPNIIKNNPYLINTVKNVILGWWERVCCYFRNVIVYLPRKYTVFIDFIKEYDRNLQIHEVKYNIFYGHREIKKKLIGILGKK